MTWKYERQRHCMAAKGIKTKYTSNEIRIANMTSRTSPNKKSGAGTEAITPRIVRKYAKKTDAILDFGSGKYPKYTIDLKNEGYKNVTAYEFGDNINPLWHDENALDKKYNIVFASNVLNVQSTENMLDNTLYDISRVLKSGGLFIANYPSKPRKMNMTNKKLENELNKYFKNIKINNGVYVMEVK